MIVILSSAKTLDFETEYTFPKMSRPVYLDDAIELMDELSKLEKKKLSQVLEVSEKLGEKAFDMVQSWTPEQNGSAHPAICAYNGDVFKQLERTRWNSESYTFCNDTLRILSGLYGVLRPLDFIQPYRLEMATSLPWHDATPLSTFWANKVTKQLEKDVKRSGQPLLNLASIEYAHAIQGELKKSMISISFKEITTKGPRTYGILAKKARGKMANWIIDKKVELIDQVKRFSLDNYSYNASLSNEQNYVFTRERE